MTSGTAQLLRVVARSARALRDNGSRGRALAAVRLAKTVFGKHGLRAVRDVWKISSIEGMVSMDECMLLYEAAAAVSSGVIVEVGSYRGQSTAALALGSLRGARVPVYAIEPHEEFRGVLGATFGPADRVAFFRNMLRAGTSRLVRLVNLSSEHVVSGWPHSVTLLWIDGDHRYDAVRRDFDTWRPFLADDALVAFHDSTMPGIGPDRLVAELCESHAFAPVQVVGTVTVLRTTSVHAHPRH